VQELVLQVRNATGPLAQQRGRTPADSDLARHLGVSGAELRQARQAEVAFQPSSLDAPPSATSAPGSSAPNRARSRGSPGGSTRTAIRP
jgi:RNA polymerase sigma-B factor